LCMQTDNVVLIVRVGGKFCQLVEWNGHIPITHRFGSIGVIDTHQFEYHHISLIGTYSGNGIGNVIVTEVYSTKFCKAIRYIGERTDFEFSTNAKKGHYYSDSSPF